MHINKENIGERIKAVRKKLGLNQKDFGELMGVGQNSISYFERGAVEPSNTFVRFFEYQFEHNAGQGTVEESIPSMVAEACSQYGIPDPDSELSELMEMTREIVKSGTDHATTLTSAIRSSHKALLNERRIANAERRYANLEKRLATLEQKQQSYGPPDEKEASPGKEET